MSDQANKKWIWIAAIGGAAVLLFSAFKKPAGAAETDPKTEFKQYASLTKGRVRNTTAMADNNGVKTLVPYLTIIEVFGVYPSLSMYGTNKGKMNIADVQILPKNYFDDVIGTPKEVVTVDGLNGVKRSK